MRQAIWAAPVFSDPSTPKMFNKRTLMTENEPQHTVVCPKQVLGSCHSQQVEISVGKNAMELERVQGRTYGHIQSVFQRLRSVTMWCRTKCAVSRDSGIQARLGKIHSTRHPMKSELEFLVAA